MGMFTLRAITGCDILFASRRRHTRFKCDWSSDVCSSDLLRGHGDLVHSAAWSPDGQRIVTASTDKTARVWNADGAGEPLILRGHEDQVRFAAWSPDGKRIVT